MIRLSAFADEIAPDLNEQVMVLRDEKVHYVEIRSVWNVNVLDLTDHQVAEVQRVLHLNGIGVSAIGSPIGKVPVDEPFDGHLARLDRAFELAHAFDTPFIRIFSFYPPRGGAGDGRAYRDEVIRRMRVMADRANNQSVTLLHENDTDLYGDSIDRCVDVMTSVNSSHLGFALDPANFIVSAQTPYPDGYEALRPWLRHVHVKDARADRAVVVAGEGEARWPELLERLRFDGYEGFFSLEPHLASAGQYQGFSGPDLFRRASRAFQHLLAELGWNHD